MGDDNRILQMYFKERRLFNTLNYLLLLVEPAKLGITSSGLLQDKFYFIHEEGAVIMQRHLMRVKQWKT